MDSAVQGRTPTGHPSLGPGGGSSPCCTQPADHAGTFLSPGAHGCTGSSLVVFLFTPRWDCSVQPCSVSFLPLPSPLFLTAFLEQELSFPVPCPRALFTYTYLSTRKARKPEQQLWKRQMISNSSFLPAGTPSPREPHGEWWHLQDTHGTPREDTATWQLVISHQCFPGCRTYQGRHLFPRKYKTGKSSI